MYKLYYDSACPICNNFVSLIKAKVDVTKITFVPQSSPENNFRLEKPDGTMLTGNVAINELANVFPNILNYFWMLPGILKKPALHMVAKAGSAIRNVIKRSSGCGCNKKK
jgi:hypothetical protein